MVLGGRPPGRVGRRRISQYEAPPLAAFAEMAKPAGRGASSRPGSGVGGSDRYAPPMARPPRGDDDEDPDRGDGPSRPSPSPRSGSPRSSGRPPRAGSNPTGRPSGPGKGTGGRAWWTAEVLRWRSSGEAVDGRRHGRWWRAAPTRSGPRTGAGPRVPPAIAIRVAAGGTGRRRRRDRIDGGPQRSRRRSRATGFGPHGPPRSERTRPREDETTTPRAPAKRPAPLRIVGDPTKRAAAKARTPAPGREAPPARRTHAPPDPRRRGRDPPPRRSSRPVPARSGDAGGRRLRPRP